jgi:hypothetical protein
MTGHILIITSFSRESLKTPKINGVPYSRKIIDNEKLWFYQKEKKSMSCLATTSNIAENDLMVNTRSSGMLDSEFVLESDLECCT